MTKVELIDIHKEKEMTKVELIDIHKEKKMTNTEKEFNKLRKTHREVIREHIRANNDYHQAFFYAEEAEAKLQLSLEHPMVQRYNYLLDVMEKEKMGDKE